MRDPKARRLGASCTTVNRWQNDQSKVSKLAKVQLEAFGEKMTSNRKFML